MLLEDLLREAEANNPSLEAAYYRWQAAREEVPQVTSLNDPRLTFMEYLNNNVETRAGAQDFQLGVMQEIPYPGKLSLKGRMAQEQARALEREFETQRLEVRREVKDAFYEYYYLAQAIRITRENLELLKHFERVANARYEVARAGNQDVIKAQVELGQLENDLRALEDFRLPVAARLNAALNRPSQTPFLDPGDIDLSRIQLETESVLEKAFANNPDLQAWDARIQKERAEVELARKQYYPDFSFGLNWINTNSRIEADVPDEGADVLMGSVSMNLPIYRRKLEAGVREAEHGVREAQREREAAGNRLAVELQTALYELRNAERQIDLYSNVLIPKAQQSVEVTQSAYSTETSGFLDLIDSERVLLDFQKNYYRSVADFGQALATLESKVGAPLAEKAGTALEIPEVGLQAMDAPVEAAPTSSSGLSPEEAGSLER
jgi:outer membrane protein TolC